jgi:zinc protease
VKVVLKPTTFKEDEIMFRASSPGGTSLASDADYIPASTADRVVTAGGVGKLSQVDLRKVLAGKAVNVGAFISETDEGLSGSGSKNDLELMFQLIYLRMTQPRPDPVVFNALTTQTKAALANQTATPQFAFSKELQTTLYQNHPRRQPMTPEKIDQMSLEKSLAFYKDRFADASDFTFTFVGSFDAATLKPLVERYLASLPATHRQENWRDIGARPVTGVVKKRVEKGIEPKSDTVMIFSGPFQYNQMNRVILRALGDVLENRLRESLREDLGGTYSVGVGPNYMKVPREEYELSINFGSSPSRVDELVDAVFKQIAELAANGPTPRQLADVKETLLRNLETQSKTNSFLLTNISTRYEYGEDVGTLFNLADYYNRLTPEMIRDAAKTYLNMNNYVLVELFPEK